MVNDLIRRQDVIAYIGNRYWLKWEDKETLKKGIESLPSAQQWIPCSERLPKTDNWRTTFNVATEAGNVTSMEWENTIVRGKLVSRWIWQDRIAPWKVVAWMPLPEPYKEEK